MRRFIGYHETPFLLPYTLHKQRHLATRSDTFFLSFTDAVRALTKDFNSQKEDTVLLPGFYCPDMIAFFSSLARPVFYAIQEDLSVDEESYRSQLQKYHPRTVVQYAFFGFPEKLRLDTQKEVGDALVIMDGTHLLPKQLSRLPKNYFYIDSIRKRTNILGAHLIHLTYKPQKITRWSWYSVRCSFFHLLYALIGLPAYACDSENLYGLAGEYFEKLDDLIGTSPQPTRGGPISYWLWNHIDFKKLKNHAHQLREVYHIECTALSDPRIHLFASLQSEEIDSGYMPLFVEPKLIDCCIDFLSQKKVYVYKLWEPPLAVAPEINPALYRSLIALPLTWLTSEEDVRRICTELKNFLASL